MWPQLTQPLRLHPDQGLGLWQPRLSDGGKTLYWGWAWLLCVQAPHLSSQHTVPHHDQSLLGVPALPGSGDTLPGPHRAS